MPVLPAFSAPKLTRLWRRHLGPLLLVLMQMGINNAYAQKILEAFGGAGLGICREPTGWGYPASGVGGSFGIRYSQGGTRINGTNLLIDRIPLVTELTGLTFTGGQSALKGLIYRGEAIDKIQRFGLSFADVECQVYEGRLLIQPLLFTPDVPWIMLRARLGLVAGNATLDWLHTVTVTRVYVNRFYLGPSAGFGVETSLGDYIRLQGWFDIMPFIGSLAKTRTNEGQTNRIQNFRFFRSGQEPGRVRRCRCGLLSKPARVGAARGRPASYLSPPNVGGRSAGGLGYPAGAAFG